MRRTVAVAFLLLAVACTQGQPSDGKQSVVGAFYPLAEAAERIGGDRVEVTNLTPPGAEPHDIELTTDQLDAVLDADVVLYLKGFQPALDDALEDADGDVVDLLDGGEGDPHVWLDPRRWAVTTERIGDVLEASADRYRETLDALDADFEAGLADCERDLIVTNHAAFAHMAERYGLRQEAISGVSPEAEPAPDRLAELIDLVEREDATTVFTESLVSPEVAQTLAREAGVDVATLDPVEGLTAEQVEHGEDYVSVMRTNLDVLRDGLGCG